VKHSFFLYLASGYYTIVAVAAPKRVLKLLLVAEAERMEPPGYVAAIHMIYSSNATFLDKTPD
jgi:hypothetical protein